MEQRAERPPGRAHEPEPRTYRIILRRNFDEETSDPFVEVDDEPETNDIMFEGTMGPDSESLWEEAGLTDPIEEDKYELQEQDDSGAWQFRGFFSTSEDLQWVLEHEPETP